MRVLVTEDDEDLRLAVEASLRGSGFAVDVAKDLTDADEALSVNAYDCVVFDRMLPSGDSLGYVGERRRDGWRVPVLFLTARDTVADRIAGLALADDYLVKPFAMAELIARVRSLCRRGDSGPAPVLGFLDLELDTGRHEARRGGVKLTLTGKEFAVLQRLVVAAGEPVRRRELTDAGWDELVPPSPNALEVLIAQLRHKLGKPPVLHTVRGVGYVLRG
ncbi:winged helix-turn-helix domain-containing protein [Amycolatopsis regifaucium]|uniref:DNA-binding response regulator n=1 Tax=Amycolatopsis regifaucium TaxID=546365 RepID=A0A154MSB1_9PSEU|nr:response regulator transcription factor [Amycolatopsis regifaucium]KZB87152.1 two-component system response regulator [Amycolatopsis regifaucium]OKA07982.1 DNA-binding response regulator [Amycolatopsis regifaucium]SFI35325.1 DNA-binding response regulator, OmpR family, contains REC and winged-helix (wHTH) domain [Amycolatopsis regifaucium]